MVWDFQKAGEGIRTLDVQLGNRWVNQTEAYKLP